MENSAIVNALRLEQAGHRLFVTVLSAEQLIGATTIDYYDSTKEPTDPGQGYQRPPERSRITRIGTFVIKQQGDGLYPTAILLGARKPLKFDGLTGRLQLPKDKSLRVIDGQHRREGLRYAIEEKEEDWIRQLQIPVVIIEVTDRVEEMDQFRIINGTAKSVRTDLVNSILTAMAEVRGHDAVSAKDRWKVVVTKVVDKLNRREDSPWQGLFLMPDEVGKQTAPGKVARATSAMTSIRPIYDWLDQFGFLGGKDIDQTSEFIADILVAFWRAVRNVVPTAFEEPGNYVIQKTPGLFAMHMLLKDRLLPNIFVGRRTWDESTFEEFLQESPEITDPAFWEKDAQRAAAYGSMKGFRDLADLLVDSVAPKPKA